MGKAWDGAKIAYDVAIWQEVYRVLAPGGHLVAFGGTRTYHRLTCAIEDAGFEIRDCLSWMYGSGFPKGKGCLKPGWEPIVLARKPGASPWLNVDGCRLSALTPEEIARSGASTNGKIYGGLQSVDWKRSGREHPGRWPANVVLDEETAALLDEQSGHLHGSGNKADVGRGSDREYGASSYHVSYAGRANRDYGSAGGGASRFFYCVPPDQLDYTKHVCDATRFLYCPKASSRERGPGNDWPTVKPLALMQWLVRLVTPKGGTVLDPFCGSGSTLIAADREGFDSIGIDSDPHAVEIAQRRLTEHYGPLVAALQVTS